MFELEQCWDCDQLNVSYKFLQQENNIKIYQATCRDCYATWEVEENE